jgi:hypothetical protein
VQGRVDIRRTKIGNQQLTVTEHVQWQEAVMIVIAVKESLLLIAMYRIVGGVRANAKSIRGGRKELNWPMVIECDSRTEPGGQGWSSQFDSISGGCPTHAIGEGDGIGWMS